MSDTIDNTVLGYQFFEPDTGVSRYISTVYMPLLTAWDRTPTTDDISGVDPSLKPIPAIGFDLAPNNPDHPNRIIQYGYEVLGINLAEKVGALPDGFIAGYLNNVAYDRPMGAVGLPLRIKDSIAVNPYTLAAAYYTTYLLRYLSRDLVASANNSLKQRGNQLVDLADHVQFAIDHCLSAFNITDPEVGVIIDGVSITQTDPTDDTLVVAKSTRLYMAKDKYEAWVAKGGDEALLVANWGLYAALPTDDTITNKQAIMTAWAAAQSPAS